MRAHLLGDDRLLRPAPVRLMITGERTGGGWRDLPSWPPPALDRSLYLEVGAALGDRPPRSTGEGGDSYRYDPADPTPALGGPVLLSRTPVLDNAPLEARADVLTYTGPLLERTLEAIGHVYVGGVAARQRAGTSTCSRGCATSTPAGCRATCPTILTLASAAKPGKVIGRSMSYEPCPPDTAAESRSAPDCR